MSLKSNIGWCSGTWNAVLGCDKVSDGCRFCYAILQCWMKQHHPNPKIRAAFEGLVEKRPDGSLNWTGKVRELPDRLTIPLKVKEPTKWFVASMSDPFHEDISDDFIAQMFAVAALCPQHVFQFLTKRPERALAWFNRYDPLESVPEFVAWHAQKLPGWSEIIWDGRGSNPDNYIGALPLRFKDASERKAHYAKRRAWPGWPLPNVWIGVSTEDQKTADQRIPLLMQIPAKVRFLSCEPLLGPIDLSPWLSRGIACDGMCDEDAPEHRLRRLDWVIAGGESGSGSRPMHPDWARDIKEQCKETRVAFFFKQWGDWMPTGSRYAWSSNDRIPGKPEVFLHYTPHPTPQTPVVIERERPDENGHMYHHQQMMQRVGKHAAGCLLDGEKYEQFPEPARV